MKLVVTAKTLRYGTRRLYAGDEFEATNMHGRLLIGVKKAKEAPSVQAPVDDEERELKRLRAEAYALGIAVDGRWGAKRIQAEIGYLQNRLKSDYSVNR